MPDLLLSSIEYSSYISPIKLVVFLILFFLWLPVVNWVYKDASSVGTRQVFWTGIVFGAGAVGAIAWLLIPIFIIGMLFYIIAVAVGSLSYVMHRNTRVMDFDRVLTAEHIRSLFTKEEEKLEALKGLVFITANNNEVPLPQPRTPEFFGYKAAHDLFADAIWRRASSIVFLPKQQDYNVAYYVDGEPLKQPSIPRDQMEYLIRFLKNLGDLDAEEKRKPQKSKFMIRQEEDIEWEIITAGSTAGEQIQLKQKTQQNITKLSDLGLTANQYEQLNRIRDMKQGVFIVSGPRKSGVSSTFYALIRNHDPFIYNINTLEKQPSGELLNVTQHVFALSDTGTTTYAKKLQSVVRMGPDIVGVADCEDSETAKIAAASAKDGKIIYLEVKAENATQALGKWIKLVGDKNLAADTLIGVSNQRLLRKLCEECKQAYEPKREILRKFNIPPEKVKVFYRAGKVQYDKHGKPSTCEHCQGTGFYGRMCVFEIIPVNDALRKGIKEAESLAELSAHIRRMKVLYLQEQALKKVIDGTTSINEMVRVFSGAKRQKVKTPQQK